MTTFRNRPYRNTALDSQPAGDHQAGQGNGDGVALLEQAAAGEPRDAAAAGGSGVGKPGTHFQVDLLADWAKP